MLRSPMPIESDRSVSIREARVERPAQVGLFLIALLISGLLALPAGAVERTFGFTMSVDIVIDPAGFLDPVPTAGSTLTGFFNFEDSIVDSDASPTRGIYDEAVLCVDAVFGDGNEHFFEIVLDSAPFGSSRIRAEDAALDVYEVSLGGGTNVVDGWDFDESEFEILMQSFPFTTAMTSDALPTTPPVLAAFNAGRSVSVTFQRDSGNPDTVSLTGPLLTLTTEPLTPCPTPEPGLGIMLVAGVFGLSGLGRRRRSV